MAKYDKVSYPDDINFATGDENDQITGNGIYNVYTVGMSKYSDTFKIGCFRFQKNLKTYFMLTVSVLLVVSVVLAVIITAAAHGSGTEGTERLDRPRINHDRPDINAAVYGNPHPYGLIASPVNTDENNLLIIEYNPQNFSGYKKFYDNMVNTLHEYSSVIQVSDTEYVDCNSSTVSVPEGKVCRFEQVVFEPHCSEASLFGYDEGRPCVLFQLKLEPNLFPVGYNSSTDLKFNLQSDRVSQGHVAIDCTGKTKEDLDNMGSSNEFGDPIEYYPVTGFPTFYYKFQGNQEKFLPPAVMVQFNHLLTNRPIIITCTAYATNLKLDHSKEPQSIPLYQRNIFFKILVG